MRQVNAIGESRGALGGVEGSFLVIFGCSGCALVGFGHLGSPETPGGRPEARKSGPRAAGRCDEASAGVRRVWWGAGRCGGVISGHFWLFCRCFTGF